MPQSRIFVTMKLRVLLFALLFSLLFSGCQFQRIMKNEDWRVRYEAAKEYYAKKKYYKASLILEDLMPIIVASKEAEEIQYLYPYAMFYEKQYLMSAYYFKTFHDNFRRSPKAQEALFMHAYSLYLDSPDFNRDQQSTEESIDAMQGFLNRYPNSEYAKRANENIRDMRKKLEMKAFENAKLYYKLGRYNSAVVSLDNFRKDYPDSDLQAEAQFLRLDAAYQYAKNSYPSKQELRFRNAIEIYEVFTERYAEEGQIKPAEKIYANCVEGIEKAREMEAERERILAERKARLEAREEVEEGEEEANEGTE